MIKKMLLVALVSVGYLSSGHALESLDGGFCHVTGMGSGGTWCITNQAGADAVNRNNGTNLSPGSYVLGEHNPDSHWSCSPVELFYCSFMTFGLYQN